jgi:hypothetical protein
MREMFRRMAYLACLGCLTSGMVLTLIGMLSGEMGVLIVGLGSMAIGGLTRECLRRSGYHGISDLVLANWMQGGAMPSPDRVAEFIALLREHDALERQRGAPEFDPWALQVLRNEIRAMIRKDPVLEQLVRLE